MAKELEDVKSSFIQRIRREYSELTPGFQKVATYILRDYQDVAFLTAAKVAQKVGVSESVVVRFAMALGYSGYPDMLKDIRGLVRRELSPQAKLEQADNRVFHEGMDHAEVFRHVLQKDADNLNATAQNPINRDCGRAVEALLAVGNGRVYCMGFRGLNNLAGLSCFYLAMTGLDSRLIIQGDATMFQELNRVEEGDVLITFSFPRYTRRTTEAMDLVRDAGGTTLVISDCLSSPAAQSADVALVSSIESESFYNSYCAAVSIINALVLSLAKADKDRTRNSLESIESVLPDKDFYG